MISHGDTSPEGWRVIPPPPHSRGTVSIVDITLGLIVQITHLLLDRRREASNNHQDLPDELKSLHQTLAVIRLAIEEYESRPLGQGLANTINPAVEQCYMILHELLDRINGIWESLNITSIGSLWRLVWWGGWESDDISSLRRTLSVSRRSLEGFLMALHSYVALFYRIWSITEISPYSKINKSISWLALANELQAGRVSLARFHAILTRRLPFLGHIKLNAVTVVSHLGDVIPVPDIFCTSWKVVLTLIQML